MEKRDAIAWLRKPAAVVLAGYWLALLVATHIPRVPTIPLNPSDKVLHLAAYAGLALLVCLNWSLRRSLRWRQLATVVALLAAYGALDEVTQIPVGRSADVFDWVADVAGVLAGLAIFASLAAIYRRSDRSQRRVT